MTEQKTPAPEEAPEEVAPEAPEHDADESMTVSEADGGVEGVPTDDEEAGTPDVIAGDEEEASEEAKASPDQDGDGLTLQEEFEELNDRHLRLAAEFTNFRRRAEGERIEMWARAQADMVRQFLDALDDLQRVGAWQAETTTVEALVEGVDLVERKFRQALEAAGVEVLDPVGEPFDPNTMEAMMRVPAESEEEDDMVQDVMQKGYVLKGHLVRPARVSVKKHE